MAVGVVKLVPYNTILTIKYNTNMMDSSSGADSHGVAAEQRIKEARKEGSSPEDDEEALAEVLLVASTTS